MTIMANYLQLNAELTWKLIRGNLNITIYYDSLFLCVVYILDS